MEFNSHAANDYTAPGSKGTNEEEAVLCSAVERQRRTFYWRSYSDFTLYPSDRTILAYMSSGAVFCATLFVPITSNMLTVFFV